MTGMRIVSVSSSYGGTGKTTLAVNVGVAAARSGLRVAIVDTAMQSPGLADALAVPATWSLADYLCGDCDIARAVHHLPPWAAGGEGALFAVAAIRGHEDAAGALVGGYDPGLLVEGCRRLVDALDLDLLLLDTPAGLTTEAVVCAGIADVSLHVDRIRGRPPLRLSPSFLVVNMVPASLAEPDVLRQARSVHGDVPMAVLPYSPEFALAGAGEAFVTAHPEHGLSSRIRAVARALTGQPFPGPAPG
ncbi:MinD/ParA family protein [Streptosporangium nondiastaticum]